MNLGRVFRLCMWVDVKCISVGQKGVGARTFGWESVFCLCKERFIGRVRDSAKTLQSILYKGRNRAWHSRVKTHTYKM